MKSSHRFTVIAIIILLFCLAETGSAEAQAQSISGYSIYTDRAAWLKAVAAAGLTPAIGTQTFEGLPTGLYRCIQDPSGLVGYSGGWDCQVQVSQYLPNPNFNHVLSYSAVGISSLGSPQAIGFDVVGIEPYGGQGCSTVQVLTNISGNGISFPAPASGFVGIIAPPNGARFNIVVQPFECLGFVLLDNVSYPGGPDSSLTNPNPPVPCPPGVSFGASCFTPPTPIGPVWYDPPATEAFDFSSPDAKFLSINDFPPGFAAPFTVSTGGVVLGSFMPGQSIQFPNGGVNEFRISGISPTVDGGNPYAFPINLSLDKVGVIFTMTPASDSTPTPTPCDNPTWNGFGDAINLGVDIAPVSVTTGDFNGDGRLDMVTANADVASVSLRLGNGAGGFGAATNFTVGAAVYAVAAGDLNGDQKLDLVVAGRNANAVFVFLGNGAGGFASPSSFAVGTKPQSVTVGDFNRDGKLDLAVGNFTSNNVSILIGNGAGGFGSATNFAVGTTPFSVTTADLNGDGKLDLAVANHNSNDVSVLLGDGNGSFGTATSFASAAGGNSILASDLNGDHKLDLAIANSAGVSVFLGDGAGGFGAATNFPAGSVPVSAAVADFNGDAKPDIAIVNFSSNDLSLLLGDGFGSFAVPTNFAVGLGPESAAIGDFNADGRSDLAVANSNSDNVSVLLNNGWSCPTATPTPTPALYNTPVGIDILVQPVDSTTGNAAPITVTFSQVTTAGNTTVSSNSGNPVAPLPGKLKLGNPPIYYNITSSAGFTPPVTVCVQYPDAAYQHNEANLKLMHFNEIAWENITQSIDLQTNTVCGVTSSLSPFVVAEEDVTPPTFTVPPNINASATSSSGAAVSYDKPVASDDFDGIVPVNCSPPSGSSFALGTTQVTCSATDSAGNTTQKSFYVNVTYAWSGLLQPINADGSSVFKLGSTVPVKFALTGASAIVTNAIARLYYAKVSNNIAGSDLEATSTASASAGSLFRYDAGTAQYIFNWGTKGLTTGTYQLKLDLGDGVTHIVVVSLK